MSKLVKHAKIIAYNIEKEIDPEEFEDKFLSIYLIFEYDDDRKGELKFVEYHDILFTYLSWKDERGDWLYLRHAPPGSFPFNLEDLWRKTEKSQKD